MTADFDSIAKHKPLYPMSGHIRYVFLTAFIDCRVSITYCTEVNKVKDVITVLSY